MATNIQTMKKHSKLSGYLFIVKFVCSCHYPISNHNYIKILESDWSSTARISALIVQLHTSCACNCTVVRVMPE